MQEQRNLKNDYLLHVSELVLIGFFVVSIAVVFTYAYFNARLDGETEANLEITTAVLELSFSDNNSYINVEQIIPGNTFEKTIVVNNSSTIPVLFNLVWLEVTNSFLYDELVISATCVDQDNQPCEGVSKQPVPINVTNPIIKGDITIPNDSVYTYIFILELENKDVPQDYNQQMNMSGRIGISSTI